MLDFIDPDPGQAILKIVLAIAMVGMAVVLWTQLQHRSRRFGGGNAAAAVMAVAVIALLVSISGVIPFEIGLFVLLLALLAIYRPEKVVDATGGPSLQYRALREGRELALLVRERGGWSVARRNEEIVERVEGLEDFEGPGTERYIGLVRETVLEDPAAPGMAEKLAELAEADAELRATLRARPMFERELAKRAEALEAPATDEAGSPT